MKDAPAIKLILILTAVVAVALIAGIAWLEKAQRSLFRQTVRVSGDSPEVRFLKEHGWVPAALPESVVEFYEAHDQDSNDIIMRFGTTGPIDEITSGACVRSDARVAAAEGVPDYSAASDWWPAADLSAGLVEKSWPLYECRFEKQEILFWLTVASNADGTSGNEQAGNRVYMWRRW